MSENTPTLGESIRAMIGRDRNDLHTAIPACVVSYDAATQKATVQPEIFAETTDIDGNRVATKLPAITDVPVVFPRSGAYGITFPLAAGDTVLVVFSESSLDKWATKGGDTDPEDRRKHSLSDAIAIPGLFPFNKPTSQVASGAMVISGGEIRIGSKDASELVALHSDVSALRNFVNTHVHAGVTSGMASTSAPVGTPSVSGATKVKVE